MYHYNTSKGRVTPIHERINEMAQNLIALVEYPVTGIYPETCPLYQYLREFFASPRIEAHALIVMTPNNGQFFRLTFYVWRNGIRAELHDMSFRTDGSVVHNLGLSQTDAANDPHSPWSKRTLYIAEALEILDSLK